MRLPKTVDIGDEIYEVKFRKLIRGLGPKHIGLCDVEKKIIYIKRGQSQLETVSTFIHEVIHAMEHEYDINLTHKSVYSLEQAIRDFLVMNCFSSSHWG